MFAIIKPSKVVTALETLAEDRLTLNFVKGKLLDEELKRTSSKVETEHKIGTAFSSNTR